MHFIKSRNCRRRKIHTLGILLIIVVIYFFLQFFSLFHLGSESKRKKKPHLKVVNLNPETNVHDDEAKSNNNHEPVRNSDKLVGREKEEQVSVPRGVLSHDAAQYTKDSLGQFKCLKSELYIPAERVNDNFCDCPDSSDEPGTSACPSGRFYCRVQLPHQNAQFVHSSKVNDGICDCCDGSDEWKGQQVPAPVQLHGKKGAVFQTPCENHCGDLLQLMEHEEKIRRQGVLLQKQYLEAARSLSPKHLHQFGPQGIFYLLSKECYQHAAHEYLYTICPFKSVQQSQGALSKTVLGRQGQWSQLKPGDYILDMLGGDARLCPDGKSRETQIRFLCGLEDRVINVSEDQKCRYVVRFSSPAAC